LAVLLEPAVAPGIVEATGTAPVEEFEAEVAGVEEAFLS
jgi:hypothetical protein